MRRYPPLVLFFGALALALAVLPSALTLPQTSLSRTLEYAPVPASERDVAPQGGNLTSLGLATSGTLGAGIADGAATAGRATAGVGKSPSTKRCVGSPPRQTEDVMSPPCVAYFTGDNFGATHPGVTRGEVRILFYFDGKNNANITSRGNEPGRINELDDLGRPPPQDEFVFSRLLRMYQRYFNERYQTYGRTAHFFVHYGRLDYSPEARRADASEALARVKPFAVVSGAADNADGYVAAMAGRGVVTFLGTFFWAMQPEAFYAQWPGLLWSYRPSVDRRAASFVSYACRKVVGHPVSFSGNPADAGPRVLGFLRTDSASRPDLVAYASQIRRGIEQCGGTIVAEGTFADTINCYSYCTNSAQYAADNMARFQQRGVTTVSWAGGYETRQTAAAAAIGYRPQFVVAGDSHVEWSFASRFQDPSVWQHARVVTPYDLVTSFEAQPCLQAARESDSAAPRSDVMTWGCDFYRDTRQVMNAIQVSGPRLHPQSIDKGFHAIPAVRSGDPAIPACFYAAGDYTCVKDAQAQWWDPSGTMSDWAARGCWRSMQGGRRYVAGDWPDGDVDAQRSASDPCNQQGSEVA